MIFAFLLTGDDVQEKPLPNAAPKPKNVLRVDRPTDVAGVTALIRADFWKLRAQMLIYHREVIAELDRLYETRYGTPPRKPRKRSASRDRAG